MNFPALLNGLVSSLLFSIVGIAVFCLGFILIDKLTPYNLWQELIEKKNVALAIVAGFACLSIALIIAACLHG